jgi:RNA polymerase sigma-70 factor (ECF subfamily)
MVPIDFVSSEIKHESQTDGPLLQEEKELVLLMALQKLPENQRMAFQLYNNEEFSYIEIAEKMQVSISAIESLLFRARKNLKNYLVPYKNCAL